MMNSPQCIEPDPAFDPAAKPTFQPVAAIATTAPASTNRPYSFSSRPRHRTGVLAALAATSVAAGAFATMVAIAPSNPSATQSELTASTIIEPDAPAAAALLAEIETAELVDVDIATEQAGKPLTERVAPSLPVESARWAQMLAPPETKAEALVDQSDVAVAGTPPRRMTAPDLPSLETWEAENHTPESAVDEIDPAVTAAINDRPFERVARATRHVNLRAAPGDGAKVLTVVPAKGELGVVSCDHWCEVDYNGTRGFIYKSFLR